MKQLIRYGRLAKVQYISFIKTIHAVTLIFPLYLWPSSCTEEILTDTTHGQHLLLITFSTRGISSSGFLLFVHAYIYVSTLTHWNYVHWNAYSTDWLWNKSRTNVCPEDNKCLHAPHPDGSLLSKWVTLLSSWYIIVLMFQYCELLSLPGQ